ncbi:MAG TPA: tetratricopeptide repeat protein [Rhizomicrobium sp.]|nr:tetratricopeptide repeat protein [Rhizomicrobium sp.]
MGGRQDSQSRFEQAFGLHRSGDLDRAAALYGVILQADPTHFAAAHMLGALHLQRSQFEPAERQLRRALQLDPYAADALNNLGLALRHLDRLDEALDAYDRAIALRPNYAQAFCNRGNALRLLKRPDEALAAYDRAVALDPAYADAYYNRGGLLEELQRWDDAVAAYEIALALRPGFPQALNNLGNALRAVCRYDEALDAYDRALALAPGYAEALTNRGNVQRDLQRYGEALASHEQALALRPDLAEAFNNRGSVHHAMRLFAQAKRDYRHTLALSPHHMEARSSLGLTQLLLGEWEEGWENYELRFRKRQNAARRPAHPASQWAGEALAGKHILLYGEQGFGDVIQFVRFVPLLQSLGARVTVMAHRRLHRLLATVAADVAFVDAVSPAQEFDFQSALMSLPRALGVRAHTVPAPARYLKADAQRSEVWRTRLGEHGFKVGLAWQGNPAGTVDNGRSVPLHEFQPLSGIARVRLVSLQKNHGVEQLDRRPAGMTVETPGFDFDDGADAFLDTAAMMMNLDLVVTSDTSIAHLAGALGRPVWIALKQVPDWRWLLDRADSPWYPSARLFRQSQVGDWAGVARDMTAALRGLVRDAATDGDISSVA